MGFIIHKYFLSKSLSAPPPSDKKKKSGKTLRRSSQPAGGVAQPSASDYLSVPDNAYAGSTYGAGAPSRRRRNSMSGSTSSFRRASMPAGSTVIIEESSYNNLDDSMGSLGLGLGKQKSFRRASLQCDSAYRQEEINNNYGYGYNQDNNNENSFSGYYQMDDTKEETPYGDWEDSSAAGGGNVQRRFPRRSSTGSAASLDNTENGSMDGNSMMGGGGGGGMMSQHPIRLQQENRWLQLQLKQVKRHCAQLESKLYGARDQLAYTNASWLDQLYDTQHKHQQEVFQSQRQAEKASNAVLEQEFEELKNTLTRVAQEEAKLEEKRKELNLDNKSNNGGAPNKEEYNVRQLHAELVEWKERHAQATANGKRIQDILEQEALERNSILRESERRVKWLEEELHAIIPPIVDAATAGDEDRYLDPSIPVNARHVALLQQHQSELEERVQELLIENAQLQRGQAQSYELQSEVKELQGALNESLKQQDLHQAWHLRQVEHWKQEAAKWQLQCQQVETNLAHQVTYRETIRGEYANRIETLESENFNLKHELEKKQKQWTHQSNLKERTIESLKNEIDRLGGTRPPAIVGAVEAPRSGLERVIEIDSVPPASNKPLDQTVATEDTVFDGASSSSSIPEVPVEKGHPVVASFSGFPPKQSSAVVDSSELLLRAQQREKELLLQISRLSESETTAKKQAEQLKQQVQMMKSYLDQGEGSASFEHHPTTGGRKSVVAPDDSGIDELLDTL